MKTKHQLINSQKAAVLLKEFGFDKKQILDLKSQIEKMENGHFLFAVRNKEKTIITEYFKNEIYFKKFGLQYSNTKRIGQEILISNFPLPKGNVTI